MIKNESSKNNNNSNNIDEKKNKKHTKDPPAQCQRVHTANANIYMHSYCRSNLHTAMCATCAFRFVFLISVHMISINPNGIGGRTEPSEFKL